MKAAAVGLALLDAGSLQARTHQIEGVRLVGSALRSTDADAYQTARSLLAAGDVPGAMSAFRQALVQSPQSLDALNGLGVSYDRMGRYDLSRTYYESALAIDPNSALVLNNLGYSLFLQHDFKAAIPILQRVVGSADSAARANAQRLLTLVAAQIRNDAAARSTAIAMREIAPADGEIRLATGSPAAAARVIDVAAAIDCASPAPKGKRHSAPDIQIADAGAPAQVSIAAPRARIEQSSNGEQRLVLGGPAPDRVLTASLGDAAVLVMVAPAWTAADERALAIADAARERMEARAAAADIAEHLPAQPIAVATASLANLKDAARLEAEFPTATVAAPQVAIADMSQSATVPAALVAPAPARSKRRRETPLSDDSDSLVALAESNARTSQLLADAAPSAWLLAGHRLDRPGNVRTIVSQGPREEGGIRAFESDDGDLNAFAARMRGVKVEPAAISDAEAVARLEALLARLRSA